MSGLALIVGVLLIAIGIVALAKPDWMWAFTEWTNSARGQVSERSDAWARANSVGAVIAIAAGAGLVLLSLAG